MVSRSVTKLSSFRRFALGVGLVVPIVAGCSGSQSPIGAPGAMPLTERQLIEQQPRRYHPPEYKVLFSFGSNVHGLYGAYPIAPLVYVNGTFYGTTEYGGTYGYGTVFGLSPTGQESVLYSFSPGADGAYPAAGLVYMHGRLYGTAQYGGSYGSGNYYHGYGVVFSITTKGEEHVWARSRHAASDFCGGWLIS